MPGVRALRAPAILALVLPVLADPDAKAYAEAAQSGDAAKQKDVGAALQAMAEPDTRIDFACTGFALPAGHGKDVRLRSAARREGKEFASTCRSRCHHNISIKYNNKRKNYTKQHKITMYTRYTNLYKK